MSPAVEMGHNHWTTRGVPGFTFFKAMSKMCGYSFKNHISQPIPWQILLNPLSKILLDNYPFPYHYPGSATQVSIKGLHKCGPSIWEYNSVLKRKEILTPATKRIILENVILSEISQTQMDTV